jgi:hypothetical protein
MKVPHPYFKFIIALILPLGAYALMGQQKDDVILQAMKDEMNRSMNEIQIDGKEKPFLIAYGIQDFRVFGAYATLGALMRSSEEPARGKTVRILAGSYEFNDESLDNDLFSNPGAIDIQIPVENDYYGIRRALWASTDAVYKGAVRKFQRHQQTLKEKGQALADLPHRTFAKTPVANKVINRELVNVDQSVWESYVKEASSVFRDFEEITQSGVSLTFIQGHQYFVNSEGTTLKIPHHLAILQINAQLRTEKGNPVYDQIVHYAASPEELPTAQEIKSQAKEFVNRLIAESQMPAFDEAYTGPVLFSGPAVAQVFQSVLFAGSEGLLATNAIPTLNDYGSELSNTLDGRIGKSIIDQSVTVKALPSNESFQGKRLLGSFKVDSEGVVPPDEVLLIENGILKELLNDRTITDPGQKANGHADGPGVIRVEVAIQSSRENLKKQFLDLVKEEGLPYGLIVRDDLMGRMGLLNVYKISLDGREELLRSAKLSRLVLRSLRKIEGASGEQQVQHMQAGGNQLCSFIVPQAILINDIDFEPFRLPFFKEGKYVESPLKKSIETGHKH